MSRLLLSAISILLSALVSFAETADFSYASGSDNLKGWGTGRPEVYSIAMCIDNESLNGKTIKSVNVPVSDNVNMTDCYVFISSGELRGNNGKGDGEIKASFTPSPGLVTVEIPESCTVSCPVYVGYSFRIAAIESDADSAPVIVADGAVADGFYVTSSRTYRKWNTATGQNVRSALGVTLEGDFMADNACITGVDDVVAAPDVVAQCRAMIVNAGTDVISSIAWRYEIEGLETYGTAEFAPVIAADFTSTGEFTFELPQIGEYGTYTGRILLTAVNGQPCHAAAANQVKVMAQKPVKRVAMEEYTGTWCGYCPRGWVALKMLSEELPDSFVGMAYHNADVMEITKDFPSVVNGYPYASLDRRINGDPYYGTSKSTPFGIRDDVQKCLDTHGDVNIEVDGETDASGTVLTVTSTAFYFNDFEDNPYQIQYLITEDGLTGDGPLWWQSNSFSGKTGYGDDFDIFTKGAAVVTVPFNDVVIATTGYRGVEGSQPSAVNAGDQVSHSYSFDCTSFTSLTYPDINLLQDISKVSVVALVVDRNTGIIVNSAKKPLTLSAGMSVPSQCSSPVGSAFYDITGRVISRPPRRGVYIEIVRYSDGSEKSFRRVN